MRLLVIFILFLTACGTPVPRDHLDGAMYARGTLDGVYESATVLRSQGKLSDARKQDLLDATAKFEVVLQMVEDGKNAEVSVCASLVNDGLKDNSITPLASASSCLDALIQGLTLLKGLLK